VLSFVVNTDLVENRAEDWEDLLKPEYANMVALAGDPRASNQAIVGCWPPACRPRRRARRRSRREGPRVLPRAQRGRQLRAGDRQGRHARPGRDADRHRLGLQRPLGRDALAGNPPLEVVVPQSGILAGVYVQAISAYAPQPNAAKLWMEYLYSDEGQLGWLKGYCHPIRFNDLVERGVSRRSCSTPCRRPRPTRRRSSRRSSSSPPTETSSPSNWDSVVGANVE
jgi:putative spermidine/putrescine transport system substrate-binding protein